MNRFVLIAFALAFAVPASDAVIVPLVSFSDTSSYTSSYNSAYSAPHALCDAIQALEHDICTHNHNTNTPLALLCDALSELNSTLCAGGESFKSIPVQKICPLLEFIDTELCPNSTTTGGSAATDSHTPTLILAHINPAEFCPIIKLFDEEICGQVQRVQVQRVQAQAH